ncbi:MAG: hypothetical protein JKY24_08630 [Pseudomonadales bacterium]|nr:hypothetical protein [Pseudomonadales bacterium]
MYQSTKELIHKGMTKSRAALSVVGLMAMTQAVNANTVAATDDFFAFYQAVDGWAGGGLAVGISITAILVGAGVGLARSSAMPALIGIAMAAIIGWGPGIVLNLVLGQGAVL